MPPRGLRGALLILHVSSTLGKFISPSLSYIICVGFITAPHKQSHWALCLFVHILHNLYSKEERKNPSSFRCHRPFSLYLWGFDHFLLYSGSTQGIFFTSQSLHGPDLTENHVWEQQDFIGIWSLSLLLFPPAFISLPKPSSQIMQQSNSSRTKSHTNTCPWGSNRKCSKS